MTFGAIALIVATSIGWAGFDATRKSLAERIQPVPLGVLLMVGQLPFWLALALTDDGQFTPGYWRPGLASAGLNILANWMFLYSVRIAPLSRTIPLLSLTPAFSVGIAMPLLGEFPSTQQAVGITVVVVGALLLNFGGGGWAGIKRSVRELVAEKGSLLMLGVAVLWSASSVFDKSAAAEAGIGRHALVQCGAVAIALFGLLVVQGRVKELAEVRRSPKRFAASIAFGLAALGFQLWALQVALVSVVEAMKRGIGMTSALLIGRFSFGERIGPAQWAAVAMMTVGVVLVLRG